jgi:hypothetical protein
MKQTREHSNRGAGLLSGEEHRRSQRVIVRIPITLTLTDAGKAGKISAHTVAVNIHGAMALCPRSLEEGFKVELENGRTGEKIGSRVTRAPRECPEGFLIPLEFTTPSPNFWQITFPPTNWKAMEN